MIDAPTGKHAKQFGAYYTDKKLAEFMLRWAVRNSEDTVLDPSFGGGVFIEAAAERLSELGGKVSQVKGVELDACVHNQVATEFASRYALPRSQLIQSDFFEVDASNMKSVDAVVGNPPYIRYQAFKTSREKALERAKEQGVTLSALASSWASFTVHSCSFLKPGGRLAFIIPAEIGHAPYARPVLAYLLRSFEAVRLVTFRKRLFPDIAQDALLLLADNKGSGPGSLHLKDFKAARDLNNHSDALEKIAGFEQLDAEKIISGKETLSHAFISQEARRLYRDIRHVTLGEIAELSIGYVSGANKFFHLSAAKAEALGIAKSYLKPAVFRGRALKGLVFTKADFVAAPPDSAGYLLHLDEGLKSESVKTYIEAAERQGVHLGYKCTSRSPWYRVPGVVVPDAFLTYMSGLYPQLVANAAGATAPNTLHVVRIKENADIDARSLSLLWNSSLTLLSTELEGHALGGGMLKLEPSEAKAVKIACSPSETFSKKDFARIDALLRASKKEDAVREVDKLLQSQGLSAQDCETLRDAAELLRRRRYYKGGSA